MKSIQVRGRVSADGTLDLHVATGLPQSEVDVLVVVQPVSSEQSSEGLGWPPGLIERFAGVLADDPIERGKQGVYEVREDFE